MNKRYLLYIDILGFSELIKSEVKTKELYKIIDSLNAHKHSVFQTIVFSDTILVYNKEPVKDKKDAEYIIWYAIEFAQDLHFKLIGKNLFFRAMLTYGDFEHYHLKNTECFFGQALVDAYNSEKHIPSTGLFIGKECLYLNKFFQTEKLDGNWHFVYLENGLDHLKNLMSGSLPLKIEVIGEGETLPYILWTLKYLNDLYSNMREHPSPIVRIKYLTTWDFYFRKYPDILIFLVKNEFSVEKICPEFDWKTKLDFFRQEMEV